PGLASMVSTDENGVQSYDSALLAGAALGLVAELARVVLNIKLREDYADDNGQNIPGQIPEADTTTTV
ncbi:MAG: hypothetical protein II411_02110, partial [Lachnospiraceae bacterium]|nr:hypothetical protein [Lachnospiraceae bacterium]